MPDGLYERDALAWAEQQADLLARLAAGERVNAAVDWAHVVEEVRDLGIAQLRACESLLVQAMLHLLKAQAWPGSRSARHWLNEASAFLSDARRHFTPSMRQRLDLAGLYADALQRARRAQDESGAAAALPDACPFSLAALLRDEPEILLAGMTADRGG